MKYYNGKKKSKLFPVLCMLLILLVIAATAILLVRYYGLPTLATPTGVMDATEANDSGTIPQGIELEETEQQNTVAQETVPEGVSVQTPYGVIYYPDNFGDTLYVIERNEGIYTLEFYGRLENKIEQALFDLSFGANVANPLGVMMADDGSRVVVGYTIHEIEADASWSQEEYDILLSMQESVNDVLGHIKLEPISYEVSSIVINTAYGPVSYPAKWQDNLVVEYLNDDPYIVEFYGQLPEKEKQLLFSFTYNDNESGAIVVINDAEGNRIALHLSVSELDFDNSWSEEEMNVLYSMQEGLNDVIDSLMTD